MKHFEATQHPDTVTYWITTNHHITNHHKIICCKYCLRFWYFCMDFSQLNTVTIIFRFDLGLEVKMIELDFFTASDLRISWSSFDPENMYIKKYQFYPKSNFEIPQQLRRVIKKYVTLNHSFYVITLICVLEKQKVSNQF